MGNLTVNEVEELQEAGVLTKKTVTTLQEKGLASARRRSSRRYMKTADGKWVSPTLYWRGAKDTEPSKRMQEFKDKFQALITEYTTTTTDSK